MIFNAQRFPWNHLLTKNSVISIIIQPFNLQKNIREIKWNSQPTVWKNEKFSLTENNFRQINYLVISWVKPLLTRNFSEKSVWETFYNFHTVTLWKLQNFTATIFSQKFRQINVLLNNFTINWFDGKRFAWQWISRFSTLWLCNLIIIWRNFTATTFCRKNSVKSTF